MIYFIFSFHNDSFFNGIRCILLCAKCVKLELLLSGSMYSKLEILNWIFGKQIFIFKNLSLTSFIFTFTNLQIETCMKVKKVLDTLIGKLSPSGVTIVWPWHSQNTHKTRIIFYSSYEQDHDNHFRKYLLNFKCTPLAQSYCPSLSPRKKRNIYHKASTRWFSAC